MVDDFPYRLLDRQEMIFHMNEKGRKGDPFLFVADFEAKHGYVISPEEANDQFVRFDFHGKPVGLSSAQNVEWKVFPVGKMQYEAKFGYVKSQIALGNSFLVNLTQPSEVQTDLSPEEIYGRAYAPYKLWMKDRFLVFSPETFVKISDGMIRTYPMKGTIDASVPDAERIILQDEKEKAEHATIVDLLRNDLSMVAEEVDVTRYRYVEKVKTLQTDLLQISSEISGTLSGDYMSRLGDILFALLPAGSICGAPKSKTLEIIRVAEGYDRGFYTGVCGFFDGETLDSAVMIRFIDMQNGRIVFKSGGGITFRSQMDKEYEELIQKVYVPVY